MPQHKNPMAAGIQSGADGDRNIEVPTQRTVKWPRGGVSRAVFGGQGPASSPFNAARTTRSRLPPLSLASLNVADNVPEPARFTTGNSKYDGLFEQLVRDGQSVTGIPAEYTKPLQQAAKKFLERRPALAAKSTLRVARIDASTCGIWRKAKEAGK